MGVQQFGPKKLASIRRRFPSLDIDMLWNTQGTTRVYEGRTSDDRHFELDVRIGKVEWLAKPLHATSCRQLSATRQAAPGFFRRLAVTVRSVFARTRRLQLHR
jgi:hypothetical protein